MINLPDIPEPWRQHYQLIETDDWHGWIANEYYVPGCESKVLPLQNLFDEPNVIKWYKNQRNRLAEVKWSVDGVKSKSVVLKSYESRSLSHRLRLKFGSPRGIRHWNNIWVLNSKSIKTPQPVILAFPKTGKAGQGLLAVETVGAHSRLRELLIELSEGKHQITVGERIIDAKTLVSSCAKYIRKIHDKEILHRDMSGGNILIPHSWDGTTANLTSQFILLDINRLRFKPSADMHIKYRIQDLERLHIPKSMLLDYFLSYAQGDQLIEKQWPKFLKYRNSYRRIQTTSNSLLKGLLKIFTYWPRAG